eukprot:9492644-Pyramimonas_sp.AAC.1
MANVAPFLQEHDAKVAAIIAFLPNVDGGMGCKDFASVRSSTKASHLLVPEMAYKAAVPEAPGTMLHRWFPVPTTPSGLSYADLKMLDTSWGRHINHVGGGGGEQKVA